MAGLAAKRYQWMISKLEQGFMVEHAVAEKCIRDSKKKVDAFLLDVDSPPKLFFFYQPRQFSHEELFVSIGGDNEKLVGKCVFFLRDSQKPINIKVAYDNSVLSGELTSDILAAYEGTLSQIYKPLLANEEGWGQIKNEMTKQQFLDRLDKFDENLKKKIENVRGDVELRTPESPYDEIEQKPAAYHKAAKNSAVVGYFQKIVMSWCNDIQMYIENDPSNKPLDDMNHPGPDLEIEYWSRRMLTLISITEQLKSKPNRVATGVLKARALRADSSENTKFDDGHVSEQEQTKNLIEHWREIDLAITDALNEAKDNVRFLENLSKVIEPLYTESPDEIKDIMPSVMNSMKMIHTLSRHYGQEVRMTNLFIRITNQLIKRCKEYIYAGESPAQLWLQDPTVVTEKMNSSIHLCETYRDHYNRTKQKLAIMPKGKQFNFDEKAIFGKFTRFRRRLEKLIDMFSSIQQFKAIEIKRIDGMEKLISSFDALIQDFQIKGHDLLDFYDAVFERDFVEFTMLNSGLENAIQDFMEQSLTQMSSIDKQLSLLKKFQDILHREALQDDLEQKYLMVFKLYGEGLHEIQRLYEKHKDGPMIPRNMTRIAGNIHWSRQLLRRITGPMKKFLQNPKVFHPKESKKIVKHYNKLARTLIEFETLWLQAWQRSTDTAKKGLRSRLIVADKSTGKLHVNFDQGVLQLMREARHLQLMGCEIPNSAKIVLLLEDKLKSYYNELQYTLGVYNRVTKLVPLVTRSLLSPHFKDLERSIRPAMTTMTWTSMNIDRFLSKLHAVLGRFEHLVTQINDILQNRVHKNLDFVSNLVLLDIPNDKSFTLRDFVTSQRAHIEKCTEILVAKNIEIERAIDDLIDAVMLYKLNPNIENTPELDVHYVKLHFCHLMYHALLTATKRSMNALKRRVSSKDMNTLLLGIPLFEVDMSLEIPQVCLNPSLTQVQETIKSVARDVLQCTQKICDWGIDDTAVPRAPKPFYEKLAANKDLAVALLLLTGAVENTKSVAQYHLARYKDYSWLWLKDPETSYNEFVANNNPILEDFIAELHRFVRVEEEIKTLPMAENLGSLKLRTENLKLQLKHETERWKFQYSEKLHEEAKRDMEQITELMQELKSKLEREVKDFASLKSVMDAQAEIRDVQSMIDMKFQSITGRYNILEKYLPFGAMTKDEMDAKSVLRTDWSEILKLSETVMKKVNTLQGGFKEVLVKNVVEFKVATRKFRTDYDINGPMVKGTSPSEAMTRLSKYKREFETLNRKYELYNGGEKLFGLPEQKYPDLVKTRKELRLLDSLYSLYQSVISTVDEYKGIPWSEVVANIQEMNETVEGFNQKCRHLPRGLKSWEAYLELSQTIEDFIEVLPLLTELSNPAMRDRHWKQISELTGKEFDLEKFNELKLRKVLEANLLEYREDIEEITDGAEKQMSIEKKIVDIQTLWDVQGFEFAQWKDRGEVILAGGSVSVIVEQLEESQATLVQMLTQRHVTPFREVANSWLKKLSDVNDTLEHWIKVQMLWMSLEAVFTGGDIARQMPQDTRVFMKVDKEWTTRMMNKAKDLKLVVDSCENEYIKNMLPTMFTDLEKCQKALDGYLEAKRGKFPRFYFLSNPALLLILSQGSDKDAVQDCFSKIFDSINRVEFQGNNIIKMKAIKAGVDGAQDEEVIPLTKPVVAKGNIEDWLAMLLKEMNRSIKDVVRRGARDYDAMPLVDFVTSYPAQVALLGIQFMWTSDVQEALNRAKHEKNSLLTANKKQAGVLAELATQTTLDIPTKMERTKIETLITIQVHQRDVLDGLVKRFKEKKLRDAYDFEWQKQLRCYWVPEEDECVVKIADVDFAYCYEYLGCKERLVVTPLTDRCYISVSQALGMCFGASPAGPAGTGKTETVKDLGRALGKLVVVFNCSDQMHTAETAKLFKGLCQSGSWGCFDEFNRIELEVLSVVAQQVESIFTAMRARLDNFLFPGDDVEVALDARCGFFITMNPTYAGRNSLPENLKAQFRGIAMMLADREIIIKVKLASYGYIGFVNLAKKFKTLYNLCEEQLSVQKHYDFGLRNVLSVLRTAGVNLRVELAKEEQRDRDDLEEMLMMRTLRDMNLSKLVADDVGLFISLLHDLFPNQKSPEKRFFEEEEAAMRKVIADNGLVHHDSWVTKCVQLYETSLVRYGIMMVGPAGGGKSTAIRVLLEALTLSHEKHLLVRMNPKAIKAEEMFGDRDLISGEWTHGIFSSLWAKYNDVKKHNTWIVCDGPVDTIWIESLNSVLDDNKLLTLANGDRIAMTDNVRLLFEIEDLRNASPATVSRAGIIYVSSSDLGHTPIVESWLMARREEERVIIQELYNKFIVESELLDWLRRSTTQCMKATASHLVSNCFTLMHGLLQDSVDDQKLFEQDHLERLLVYAITWSLGGLLEADDRVKFSEFIFKIAPDNMPELREDETIYEYFVSEETMEWERWEATDWEYDAERFKFSTCLVPTVDSVRAEYLIDMVLEKLRKPVLLVGSCGTAKTSIVLQYTNLFDSSKMLLKKVNFSSVTTAGMFQASIEADIEKRQGKTYAPPGGRFMTVFLDDLSMPEINKWGDQPTLELVRQIIEDRGFYSLEKDRRGDFLRIDNVKFIGAMTHPGGGRNDIPSRLKRYFYVFNVTPPSKQSIDNIYGSMLRGSFEESQSLLQLVPSMTTATIELWLQVRAKMLPTPSKFHYSFNMRDLSRVFQGVLSSELEVIKSGNNLPLLWMHECERVFCDRLVSFKDKNWFKDTLMKVTINRFGDSIARTINERKDPIYFVNFLRDDIADPEDIELLVETPKVYEPVESIPNLLTRVDNFLHEYNEQPSRRTMELVLFQDALEHMMRISRVITMPRGSALLVGIGGSGRQSLTRLAAFIARQDCFQISLTRTYKLADFLEDIKKMFIMVGKEGKKLTWIFTDFEIINEEFLEYINAILATGEVAGLFPKDERDMMVSELRNAAKHEVPDFVDTPDNLYKYFIQRIRDNLHIVLCFSPANEKFAERARRFPGLISGCNIDWFLRWPQQALIDVSQKFISEDANFQMEVGDSTIPGKLVEHIANVHDLVTEACSEYLSKFRRTVHVTPKSYLSFINSYKKIYKEKLDGISAQQRNVQLGLQKLKEAEIDVDRMKGVLEQQNIHLAVAEKEATAMLEKLEVGAKEANIKKAHADSIEEKCAKTANIINQERAVANKELEQAMPFVHAAEKAARSINKKDISLIQKFGNPVDLIKRIMDCVLILNQRSLDKVAPMEIKISKDKTQMFIADSYASHAKKMMVESGFIKTLLDFSNEEKDAINEETMEFLEPYLTVPDFNAERAKQVANAAEGLCKWVIAMASYHKASLIVGPKLEQLKIKTGLYDAAMGKLATAKASSKAAQDEVDGLQEDFSKTMKEKSMLEQKAKELQEKMIAANNLIKSLSSEKGRWAADAQVFQANKLKLVGDCALACAFVSYLGPFNYEFRKKLMDRYFLKDCLAKGIPVTKDLHLNQFLVDDGTVAKWNSEGLPKDDLSIQNGILVTKASRYPLLIDPQGQAMAWLKKRENDYFPHFGPTTLHNSSLRDQLEFCLQEGKPLLIEGVVKEVDPMFDPVLEKNFMPRGKKFFIMLGEKSITIDMGFRMYLVTKLSNPKFSPELSAKTTIIDFSVTQSGLEDQLLSRVIQQEQKSLEEQRKKLIEEVNANTIALQTLDKQLLERLSASEGNLLDDVQLIGVLADTKTKAQEVKEKIVLSEGTEQIINKKREQYRPVATRGSILYFVIVALSGINCMYQTSLRQFLIWFDGSMSDTHTTGLVAKRVEELIGRLTYDVYININRGLFEKDKLTFKLMVCLQILSRADGPLTQGMINLLLRGGSALTVDMVPRKPFEWLIQSAWLNICQLSQSLEFFGDLKSAVEQNEVEWRKWYEAGAPEDKEIPRLEDRLQSHPSGAFMRFLLIRCFRDDRALNAANDFIGINLGERYTEAVPVRLDDVLADSSTMTPIVLLLTPGADPTSQLQDLAKKQGVKVFPVSMGEGQEAPAAKLVEQAMENGTWALLQNCHLGLGFMNHLHEDLAKWAEEKTPDPNFRLWITCEPHPDFPITLLQMSIKVTNEPPRGMRAGLLRSYTSVVDAERLARVETEEWRRLVFCLCFLHSTVQERRKFGSIGWAVPYEFNTPDLEASLTFLEKHSFANHNLSWPTVQYMICEVQYGGRITDDFDRILFNTFGNTWLAPDIMLDDFAFAPAHGQFQYKIPNADNIEAFRKYVQDLPSHDSPEIFGLHVNADLTFGTNETMYILNTIADTQPRETSTKGNSKTREDIVVEKAEELLAILPKGYKDEDVRDLIRKRPKSEVEFVLGYKPEGKVDGFSIPLNVFLYQEINRLNATMSNVRNTLVDLKLAINGEIIMTPLLISALDCVFDGKPPVHWYTDSSGEETAWTLPSLSLWFNGIVEREKQLTHWLTNSRPVSYWLTGFYNPQGFLTATRQEITRRHREQKWALDDVILKTEVTDQQDLRRVKSPPDEGVFIHGMFLEGSSWGASATDPKERQLVESSPKELFTPMPIIKVTAVTSEKQSKKAGKGDHKYYDCPVYTTPKRTDFGYVFSVKLKTDRDPSHWVLRGVALLLSRE